MTSNFTDNLNNNFANIKEEIETIKTNYTPLQTTNAINQVINNIPSKTSDLMNDSGFLTGVNSSDIITALGYTPANITLSNLGTTSSVNIDGQWISSTKVLTTTSTGTGTFAYNLRPTGTGHLDYLPDDNYVYEVLASFYQHCSSTACTSYLSSDIIDETSTIPTGSNGRYQIVVANIPVQNTISFRRETASATGVDFRLLAYRRVGTNN